MSTPAWQSDWIALAACTGIPLEEADEMFFPETEYKGAAYALAVQICAGCAVREKCLEAGLAEEPSRLAARHGVLGGLTPIQRATYATQGNTNE